MPPRVYQSLFEAVISSYKDIIFEAKTIQNPYIFLENREFQNIWPVFFVSPPRAVPCPRKKEDRGGRGQLLKGLSSHDNSQAHGRLKTSIIGFLNLHG